VQTDVVQNGVQGGGAGRGWKISEFQEGTTDTLIHNVNLIQWYVTAKACRGSYLRRRRREVAEEEAEN